MNFSHILTGPHIFDVAILLGLYYAAGKVPRFWGKTPNTADTNSAKTAEKTLFIHPELDGESGWLPSVTDRKALNDTKGGASQPQ